GIHFDTRIEVQDAQSRIDPEQLEQVISNIALNAVEAMDGEGRITVELLHLTDLDLTCTSCLRPVRGRMLCLRITDDGPGISGHPEDLFTPFATGTNDGSRSGLGLSVVHGIVHQHGGHLTLRNHPERGCEVSILLPPVTYLSELTLPAVNRILLIRPDPALALEHFEALEGEYDLEAVSSTSAALEYFIEHQQVIRLVVIDSALQLKRWLDLADDMRRLQPRLPLLIFNDALDRDTRSQVEKLTAQDGRLQVVNPKASDFSPLAAVHRMLEPTTAESLRVDPLLDSWRSSR
ncbi:MAG: ATP-binding protein, partial [Pseudomonadota bacterium]